MSESTFEDRNNTSSDYKIEDLEDVQSQLYANIYYKSNVEGDSRTMNVPKTIGFHSVTDELNYDTGNQRKPDNKRSMESDAVQESVINDASKAPVESVQTTGDRASAEEATSTLNEPVGADRTPENSLATKAKKSLSSSSKKSKSSKSPRHARKSGQDDLQDDEEVFSKFNVLQKHEKQKKLKKLNLSIQSLGDSSDSDSIFEVPVPPKPKPLLIDLPDSEEEDNTSSKVDKRNSVAGSSGNKDVSKAMKVTSTAVTLDVTKGSTSRNKDASGSRVPFKRNTLVDLVDVGKESQAPTRMPEPREDIVLNCTRVQKEVRNINDRAPQEFQSFAKPADAQNASARNWNTRWEQYAARNAPHGMSRANSKTNANLQEESYGRPVRRSLRLKMMELNIARKKAERNIDYLRRGISTNMTEFSRDSSYVTDWKRRRDDEDRDNPGGKRQCVAQRCDQDVGPHSSSSGQGSGEPSSVPSFNSMPESMRNRYYSSRGQENFSIAELHRGMSRDPRMWAILKEDMMPYSQRPWKMRCMNCHEDGHRRSDCTNARKLPCCHMCGMEGHNDFRCPKKICLTCGKQQSTYRKTCEFCRVLYCTMCNSVGHILEVCPDLWRRYHQTISTDGLPLQDPGNVMKPPNLLHCCNCAKRGHESSTCNAYRWSPHFPTPAAVTSYVDGPMYLVENPEPRLQTNIPTPVVAAEKIPVSQSPREQTTEERTKPSANAEASSASQAPISQEAPWVVRDTRETSRIPITIEPSCPAPAATVSSKDKNGPGVKEHRKQKLSELNEMHEWINAVYKCGKILDKNNKSLKLISQNLAGLPPIEHYFSISRREVIISNLKERKIAPIFLEKLSEKVEFEVKIGFIREHSNMMMQVIAVDIYVGYIYRLLLHWIHIPDDEKDYGIDTTLPMNCVKMYNLLKTRKPQLEKMCFKSLAYHTMRNENDPQSLFQNIKQDKATLEEYKKRQNTIEYFPLRKKLWRLQIKLLIIVNTATALKKCNVYVSQFLEELTYLQTKAKKQKEKSKKKKKENLDPTRYLKLILLYNRLFVPHTSRYLHTILHCIRECERTKKDNKNYPSQAQQRKITTSHRQDNPAPYTNAPLFPATSCTVQDIDPPLLPLHQHVDNNISIERNDGKDIPLGTSDAINDNSDELFIIDNIGDQNFQTAPPLTTESIPVQSNCTEKDEASTSDVNYKVNAPSASSEGNAHVEQINQPQLNSQLNSKKKERIKKRPCLNLLQDKITRNQVLQLIEEARTLQTPHMIKAANELEKKINTNIVMSSHISTLRKLIHLERRYQKNVKNFCHYLQE